MPHINEPNSRRIRKVDSEDQIWQVPERARGRNELRNDDLSGGHSADDIHEFIISKSHYETHALTRGSQDSFFSLDRSAERIKFQNLKPGIVNVKAESQAHRAVALKNDYTEWSGLYATSRLIDFDIEAWWRRSNMRTRINTFFVVLLFVIMLMYLVTGFIYISTHFKQKIRSPYVCTTKQCKKAAQWLKSPINTSVDPCDNFYEFMCDNYHTETESGKEGRWMAEVVTNPRFKVEFGEDSMLAKLLANFRQDPEHDQPIRFYQACLNHHIRKKYGLTAFVDKVKIVFGTKDFSKFESTTLSMEEIGSNMLRYFGNACYLNFAFYTYPYIMILRPTLNLEAVLMDPNEKLSKRVFENLLPVLGVSDPSVISDAVNGLHTFSKIVRLAYQFKDVQMPKSLTATLPPDFMKVYKSTYDSSGLCPPMGIQLDIEKVFKSFIKDDFRLEFFDLAALKHYQLLKLCFAEIPSKFTHFQVTYQKTSFVSVWLFSIFWDLVQATDAKNLTGDWKINATYLPDNYLVQSKAEEIDQDRELECMIALCRSLGYLPSTRFLSSIEKDPTYYLKTKRDEITQLFIKTSDLFSQIPPTEIDKNSQMLGKLIFSQGLLVDVLQPLTNAIITDRKDKLQLSDDHLRNSLEGITYTVERARQNWLGSTATEPSIKWWGYGEPNEIQELLFDIRAMFSLSGELVETYRAANLKLREKFLGRNLQNYILFPLTMYDEPYTEETLFLQFSQEFVEILRTFYALLEDPFDNRYSFLRTSKSPVLTSPGTYSVAGDWTKLIFYGDPLTTHGRPCSLLANSKEEYIDPALLYKEPLAMNRSVTTGDYTWNYKENYLSLLALKHTFKLFRKARPVCTKTPYNWEVPVKDKKIRLQRRLRDGLLENYSEEQLFFMAYVRTFCRGSWKKDSDDMRQKRFHLETTVLSILMQMEEFEKVWKCKKNDMMSNRGEPRCIRWVP